MSNSNASKLSVLLATLSALLGTSLPAQAQITVPEAFRSINGTDVELLIDTSIAGTPSTDVPAGESETPLVRITEIIENQTGGAVTFTPEESFFFRQSDVDGDGVPDVGGATVFGDIPSNADFENLIAPSGNIFENPRVISNTIVDQTNTLATNPVDASDWIWQWGQFIDHDTDLNEGPGAGGEVLIFETGEAGLGITTEGFDPITGGVPIVRVPSVEEVPSSDGLNGFRSGLTNELTHLIDGSNIYGSTDETAEALRDPSNPGRLLTQTVDITLPNGTQVTEELLPFADDVGPDVAVASGPLGGGSEDILFAAGDPRPNENNGLTAVHNLLVREHNRRAAQIEAILADGDLNGGNDLTDLRDAYLAANPDSDEADFVFEQTREIVVAQYQKITYEDWAPLLVGEGFTPLAADPGTPLGDAGLNVLGGGFGIAPYSGTFDPTVDPRVTEEFANAVFRLGHTQLAEDIIRIDPVTGIAIEPLSLFDTGFNPTEIFDEATGTGSGVDSLLIGLTAQQANDIDEDIVDGVRNGLPNLPTGGFDLATINLLRSRETGVGTLNETRPLIGLAPLESFDEIFALESDAFDDEGNSVAAQFAAVYDDIGDVELWIGSIAESEVNGGLLGPTSNLIVSDQLQRSRDADPFFYEIPEIEDRVNDILALINSFDGSVSDNGVAPSDTVGDFTLTELIAFNTNASSAVITDIVGVDALTTPDPSDDDVDIPEPTSVVSLLGLGGLFAKLRKRKKS